MLYTTCCHILQLPCNRYILILTNFIVILHIVRSINFTSSGHHNHHGLQIYHRYHRQQAISLSVPLFLSLLLRVTLTQRLLILKNRLVVITSQVRTSSSAKHKLYHGEITFQQAYKHSTLYYTNTQAKRMHMIYNTHLKE